MSTVAIGRLVLDSTMGNQELIKKTAEGTKTACKEALQGLLRDAEQNLEDGVTDAQMEFARFLIDLCIKQIEKVDIEIRVVICRGELEQHVH